MGKCGNGTGRHPMHKIFFSGATVAKIDEKGRFVLPQHLRFGLVENGALRFSLGLGLGGCLVIYRQSDIQKIVAKFQIKAHLGKYQKFFTVFFSTLRQTSCDKIGRVYIPPSLQRAVGITSDIVIAGVLNKIEVWSKKKYDAQLETVLNGTNAGTDLVKFTEEVFSLLGEDEGDTCLKKDFNETTGEVCTLLEEPDDAYDAEPQDKGVEMHSTNLTEEACTLFEKSDEGVDDK